MGSIRNVELKIVLIHLSARRLRRVLYPKFTGHFKPATGPLDAHDISDHRDSVDFLADIIDFDFHRRRSWRRHAVIGNVLMNGAHEMWSLRVFQFETEFTPGVSLGTASFLHALAQLQQDNLISSRRFAGRGISYRAGESLRGADRAEEEDKCKEDARPAFDSFERDCGICPALRFSFSGVRSWVATALNSGECGITIDCNPSSFVVHECAHSIP